MKVLALMAWILSTDLSHHRIIQILQYTEYKGGTGSEVYSNTFRLKLSASLSRRRMTSRKDYLFLSFPGNKT